MTDVEVASRLNYIIESVYKRIFCRLIEVDHYIAAEDQIERTRFKAVWHGIHQIKGLEYDLVLNLLAYFKAVVADLFEIL